MLPGMTKQTSPATKEDLRELAQRFDAKLDARFAEFETRVDTTLDALESRIMDGFALLTENLVAEFRGAANDKLSMHDDQIAECRKRLTRLERHAEIGGV